MTRVKRGARANKKREGILKQTKGYGWQRKDKEKAAREALIKAWSYSYRDRKAKKGQFKRLWQIKINAAARANGTTYSKLIHALRQKGATLDKKTLADLAENEPNVFKSVVAFSGTSGAGANDGAASSSEDEVLK